MRLIIMTGWPGVGKTTVGKILAQRTGFPLLNNHDTYAPIVHFLKKGSNDAHLLNNRVREAILNMLFCSDVPGAVITSTIRHEPATALARRCMQMAQSHGARVDFVRLECAWEEHTRRIRDGSRRGFGKTRTIRELREKMAMRDFFMGLPGYPPMIIDNTILSPARCASRIIRALGLVTRK